VRTFGFLLSRRWILFAITVALSAYACWLLGNWQFGRLDTRESNNRIIRTNEVARPVQATSVMKPATPVDRKDQWLRVTATGTYDPAHLIVWRYLTNDRSESGVDMVVPLITADGVILVDRGWVASNDSITLPSPAPALPTGPVTVVGWLRQDATSANEVDHDSGAASTRALSSVTVAQDMGSAWTAPVLSGFVDLQSENGRLPVGLTQVDLPDLSDGPHFFYGLQWWFFGALALFGFGYLIYEERRTAVDPEFAATMDARRRAHLERNAKRKALKDAYKRAYEAEKPTDR
jgi:cytochrome oxidase assembly protein ShyY1